MLGVDWKQENCVKRLSEGVGELLFNSNTNLVITERWGHKKRLGSVCLLDRQGNNQTHYRVNYPKAREL